MTNTPSPSSGHILLNVVKCDYLTTHNFSFLYIFVQQFFTDLGLVDVIDLNNLNCFSDLIDCLRSLDSLIRSSNIYGEEEHAIVQAKRNNMGLYLGLEITLNNKQFFFLGAASKDLQNRTHFMIRVEKQPSHNALESFVQMPENVRNGFNVSRLDIQQTVELPEVAVLDPKGGF